MKEKNDVYNPIRVLGGYILNLLKSDPKFINKNPQFKYEINCIKHGNFEEIFNNKKTVNNIVYTINNKIEINPDVNQDQYGMFVTQLQRGNEFIILYEKMKSIYGEKKDLFLSKTDFKNAIMFELNVRMFASNLKLYTFNDKTETLQQIIKKNY